MADTAPLVEKLVATVPAVAAASDGDQTVGEAPFAGTVTNVTYTPEAAITGANTETRTFTLVNKGAAGAGTTVVATLAMTSGVNGVAFDEQSTRCPSSRAPPPSPPATSWRSSRPTPARPGLADPGGMVEVEITRS
jgi:hypothetical protein